MQACPPSSVDKLVSVVSRSLPIASTDCLPSLDSGRNARLMCMRGLSRKEHLTCCDRKSARSAPGTMRAMHRLCRVGKKDMAGISRARNPPVPGDGILVWPGCARESGLYITDPLDSLALSSEHFTRIYIPSPLLIRLQVVKAPCSLAPSVLWPWWSCVWCRPARPSHILR